MLIRIFAIVTVCMYEASLLVKLGYLKYYTPIFVSLLILHIVGLTCYNVIIFPHFLSPIRHIPGPKGGSFINGQAATIIALETGVPQLQWMKDTPNDGIIYYRSLFNGERVVPTSQKALSEILFNKSHIFTVPPQLVSVVKRIFGHGLITAKGAEHKRQKKIMVPMFSVKTIRATMPIFWAYSQRLAQRITEIVISSEHESVVLDYHEWASRSSLDIIGIAGLGADFGCLSDADAQAMRAYNLAFPSKPSSGLIIWGLLSQFLPAWLVALLPLQRNTDLTEANVILHSYIHTQMRVRQQQHAQKSPLPSDLLSLMIQNGSFNETEMRDQCMTFIGAGHETTAAALTWILYHLARNPTVQNRLREEIRAHIPFLNSTSVDAISSLPYLRNFINEVLRFNPPLPITPREAQEDTMIGNISIPKGTTILIPNRAINRSQEFWGEDAEIFDPNRWDRDGGAGGATNNYALQTFLQGPRGCIAAKWAVAELKCLTTAIAGRFFLEEEEKDMDVTIRGGMTAKPANGMRLRTSILPGW